MATETYSASIDDLASREAVASSIPDVVQTALANMTKDPGALFEAPVVEAIKAARQTDAASYARIRAKAKEAGAGVGELDRLTTVGKDEEGSGAMFPHVEPWPEPVDGGELLRDLCRAIQSHVIADKPTIIAAALWAIHSWCMDGLTISPLAHITAPEKRCGKTVLLTVLSRLVYRPLPVSNISPAALFRSMEMWQPTLLIDEADTFLKDNEEARGLINSGLYRETAFVIRVEGDAHIPTQFRTWGAKVVCGIGKLADTIEDRSIPLRLRRKIPDETVTNIRHSDQTAWTDLQSRIARWAEDNCGTIATTRPAPAIGLNDRAQDCWEPLLAIADLAGEAWSRYARSAAQQLHGIEDEAPSINAELLTDIKAVFEQRRASRIASTILIEQLTNDEEAPWATWYKGRPMTARQLAIRLKDFGIGPKAMRLNGGALVKGYDLADFNDAFHRYLSFPSENPSTSVTRLQPHNGACSEGIDSGNAISNTHRDAVTGNTNRAHHLVTVTDGANVVTASVTDGNASQTAPLSQSYRVTDVTNFSGKKEESNAEVFEI